MNAKTSHPRPSAGNWASLLLPIAPDDSIEFDKLGEEIDILIDAKVDGIYSNGTAGEFHNRDRGGVRQDPSVTGRALQAASMPFVIGACQPDPLIMLNRVRRASALRSRRHSGDTARLVAAHRCRSDRLPEPCCGKRLMEFRSSFYNPPHAKRVLTPKELGVVCASVPGVTRHQARRRRQLLVCRGSSSSCRPISLRSRPPSCNRHEGGCGGRLVFQCRLPQSPRRAKVDGVDAQQYRCRTRSRATHLRIHGQSYRPFRAKTWVFRTLPSTNC